MKKTKKALILAGLLWTGTIFAGCGGEAQDAPETEEESYQQEEDAYEEADDTESGEDAAMAGTANAAAGPATEEALNMMYAAYAGLVEEANSDSVRLEEVTPQSIPVSISAAEDTEGTAEEYVDACTISMDGRKMLYTAEVIGEPGENGLYPLYITLHGGGGGDAETNNEQWLQMTEYYKQSVESGIYVAVRGMEDVWNMHFLDESFPMYDRLIEDMILLMGADPNRVYLLGFSAGGDGVYGIAPRMADRFAAVNMSSGHPNDVSLLNTSNLPFEIQVGIRDFYSDTALRSVRGAEFEETLNNYHEDFGFGYPHRVLVHVPEGHNYNDFMDNENGEGELVLKDPASFAKRAVAENLPEKFLDYYEALGNDPTMSGLSYDMSEELNSSMLPYITDELGFETEETDTNAVTYVNGFERNPHPFSFVWDLSTRAPEREDTAFYWLGADYSVDQGLLEAAYDPDTNTVTLNVKEEPNGEIRILASPMMMSFDEPLTVVAGDETMTVDLTPDEDIIARSLEQTGDLSLSWADEITVDLRG